MLKKRINNKKGFTLVEILVAVTILAIIVGPLLMSLFSNNRVIEQARKETEATYVAKKVMEETLADYYDSIHSSTIDPNSVDAMGNPTYINRLMALLNKNSIGNKYESTENYKSKYADEFTYDIKIVPSGKIGMGGAATDTDATANYLHVYRDSVSTGYEYNYVVFPDGEIKQVSINRNTTNVIDVLSSDGSSCSVSVNGEQAGNGSMNSAKKDFRISVYSSNDASERSLQFTAGSSWPASFKGDRYLTNYTTRLESTQTKLVPDEDFITNDDEHVKNFYSSTREQWDIALYEITVNVYEGSNLLSSAEGVVEVKIFP